MSSGLTDAGSANPAIIVSIAVDAMGGDQGPAVVARGVLNAAARTDSRFLLVGDPKVLQQELSRAHPRPSNVEIVAASEVIEMSEQPTVAFRKKHDASVVVAARLVKEGRAGALVTIGNTGAAVTVSLLTLGRISGIHRPAIATPLPSLRGTVILLDSGATPDCDPDNLYDFALMGTIYSREVIGVKRPRVGLLSNGEETSKGNRLVKETHELFKKADAGELPFEFYGNVEGGDIFRGTVDVVVCDGFTGNIVLKTGEGVASMIMKTMKDEINRSPWARPFVLPLMPAMRRLRQRIDPSEYGGAPLLGVNGITIIGHGRSDEAAIQNACRAAERAIKQNVVESIRRCASDSPLPSPG